MTSAIGEITVSVLRNVELPLISRHGEILTAGFEKSEEVVDGDPTVYRTFRQHVADRGASISGQIEPRALLAFDRLDPLELVEEFRADPFLPGGPNSVLSRLSESLAACRREREPSCRGRGQPCRLDDTRPGEGPYRQVPSRVVLVLGTVVALVEVSVN